ncbi:hypothetical protein ABHN11_12865 [Brevibacillus centrosporus]|uniref:hypothetical protein n=1 Tax=Brevibacillus centrosporus TaxID=54910 RepID=UPI003D20ACCC
MDERKKRNETPDFVDDFDDAFPDGVFATPRILGKDPRVTVRKLYDYCKQRGIERPSDLSREEMEQFLVWDMDQDNTHEIKKETCQEEIEFEKELDKKAFDVVKRLYDKTFKDLVDK